MKNEFKVYANSSIHSYNNILENLIDSGLFGGIDNWYQIHHDPDFTDSDSLIGIEPVNRMELIKLIQKDEKEGNLCGVIVLLDYMGEIGRMMVRSYGVKNL